MKIYNKITNIKKGLYQKMKITLFTNTFEDGYDGVTVYVRNLANYLIEEDRKICITFPNINVVKSVREKAGLSTRKILEETREFSPDLIHNHSQYSIGLQAIIVLKNT